MTIPHWTTGRGFIIERFGREIPFGNDMEGAMSAMSDSSQPAEVELEEFVRTLISVVGVDVLKPLAYMGWLRSDNGLDAIIMDPEANPTDMLGSSTMSIARWREILEMVDSFADPQNGWVNTVLPGCGKSPRQIVMARNT